MQKRMEKANRRINQKVSNIYQFCNGDLNKFILLLRKSVYPYEDMDSWEKFGEITMSPKEAFYSKSDLLKALVMQIMQTFKKYGKYSE